MLPAVRTYRWRQAWLSMRPSAGLLVACLILGLSVAGCAGTAGSAKLLTSASPTPDALSRFSKVKLATSSQGKAASMSASDRERIAELVARKVKERAPNRFADLAATATDPHTLQVSIAFTRYDEGSAFARFMLAGLGQIHVDAEVTLQDAAGETVIGKYDVTKTFAWGGIYGGSTNIRDVEEGFAEAVANVVLGAHSQ
jgi:Domain of unknown function (DUF4410)